MGRERRRSGSRDHYETLGVRPDATIGEIKRVYRKLAEKYHPDRTRDKPPEIRERYEKRMKLINSAKDVLTNPTARSYYDYRLGYCDSVEVQEEEIEEVEPLNADGLSPLSDSSDFSVTNHEPGGGGDIEDIIVDDEDLAAEVEEYRDPNVFENDNTEIDGGGRDGDRKEWEEREGDETVWDARDDKTGISEVEDEFIFEISEEEVVSYVEGSVDDGSRNRTDDTPKGSIHHDVEDGPVQKETKARKIPFWDGEGGREEPDPVFKRVATELIKGKRGKGRGGTLFIKGKGYDMQVNRVSIYRDDRVVIEATASGLKMDDVRKRKRSRSGKKEQHRDR